VLLGNGSGNFAPAVNFGFIENPQAIIFADFNGDSKLDIATASDNGGGTSVLLNCTVLGIEQYANTNEQANIYPNPSFSIIHVELKMQDVGNTQYTLYDINGKAVKQAVIYNLKSIIDVSDLNEGVYNISLTSGEGVINKRVVIVR
jgi:hypothetical protein